MTTGPLIPLDRLRAFIMARSGEKLADYGVEGEQEVAVDRLIDLQHNLYPAFSIDELLLRPREAIRFCDAARGLFGNHDIPDDIILRPIMGRRKNP